MTALVVPRAMTTRIEVMSRNVVMTLMAGVILVSIVSCTNECGSRQTYDAGRLDKSLRKCLKMSKSGSLAGNIGESGENKRRYAQLHSG